MAKKSEESWEDAYKQLEEEHAALEKRLDAICVRLQCQRDDLMQTIGELIYRADNFDTMKDELDRIKDIHAPFNKDNITMSAHDMVQKARRVGAETITQLTDLNTRQSKQLTQQRQRADRLAESLNRIGKEVDTVLNRKG